MGHLTSLVGPLALDRGKVWQRGNSQGLRAERMAHGAIMYGPAARRKTDFQDDEREVLHQCIRPRMWSMLLRASMGIRAHPRLTSGKASVDHYGTQSRGCAGQTVRPSLHSISQTSVGKLLNRPTVRFHFLYS